MDLKKQPAAFVAGYYRTRERFGAALFGAAITKAASMKFYGKTFDAKCADGKGLFDTAHPSKMGKATQCNQFSDAFSVDALSAVETEMQGFMGDNGEILDVAPDTILIPNDYQLKRDVFAAVGADKDPDTSNNGVQLPVRAVEDHCVAVPEPVHHQRARSPGCWETADTTRNTAARCGLTACSWRCAASLPATTPTYGRATLGLSRDSMTGADSRWAA